MGATRRRPDPGAGPVEAFAHELLVLRERAGNPDYRSMARRAHCAPSTLSTAAAGYRLPTLDAALAFVRACGGEEGAWAARWRAAAAAVPVRRERPARRAVPRWVRAAVWMATATGALMVVSDDSPEPGLSADQLRFFRLPPERVVVDPHPPGGILVGDGCAGGGFADGVVVSTPPGMWWRDRLDGFTGDWCRGKAHAIKVENIRNQNFWRSTLSWRARTPVVGRGRCVFTIHVPNSIYATAKRAMYLVFGRGGSQPVDGFSVEHTAQRGRWVTSPTIELPDASYVTLSLTDAGLGNGSVAGDVVYVTCRPA